MMPTANAAMPRSRSLMTPNSRYLFWLPGNDAGNITDQSGHTATGTLGADLVTAGTAHASGGWFSTPHVDSGTTNTSHISIAAAKFPWNLAAGQSLILSWRMKSTDIPVTAADGIAGNEGGAPGIGIRASTTGEIGFRVYGTAGASLQLNSGDDKTHNFDGTENHFVIAIDGVSKTGYIIKNGVPQGGISGNVGAPTNIAVVTGTSTLLGVTTQATNKFYFDKDAAGTYVIFAIDWRDVHCLVGANNEGLPSDMIGIAKKLYACPFAPLTAEDWQ